MTQTLQDEGTSTKDPVNPPEQWPTEGRLEFRKVQLKYRKELPPVLDNMSFVITPGEHIGNNRLTILQLCVIQLYDAYE